MKKIIMPSNYGRIFENKFVVITGVPRSGTSILAKIVGSFKKVIYLHEKLIVRLIPSFAKLNYIDKNAEAQLLRSLLFEDYLLQVIHGRDINYNQGDNSFIGNYQNIKEVEHRWEKYKRRSDVMEDVYNGNYIFVLKTNELQNLFTRLEQIFPSIKFIHIIRDGRDVISSSVKRGWYTDEYLKGDSINFSYRLVKNGINFPWFVHRRDIDKFQEWNPETRIAYIWRILIKEGILYRKTENKYLEVRYEDLVANPEQMADICAKFVGTEKSEITLKNIELVKKHRPTAHADVKKLINVNERNNFLNLMEKLKYL